MGEKAFVGSADLTEIFPRRRQTQSPIDCSAHHVRVAVILAIVLPPAYGAKRLRVGVLQREKATTETARASVSRHTTSDSLLKPKLQKICCQSTRRLPGNYLVISTEAQRRDLAPAIAQVHHVSHSETWVSRKMNSNGLCRVCVCNAYAAM